eukprot:3587261-Pyramimonas_sp.AAC.1
MGQTSGGMIDLLDRDGEQVVSVPPEVRGASLEFHWPRSPEGLSGEYQRWSTAAEHLFCPHALQPWQELGGHKGRAVVLQQKTFVTRG